LRSFPPSTANFTAAHPLFFASPPAPLPPVSYNVLSVLPPTPLPPPVKDGGILFVGNFIFCKFASFLKGLHFFVAYGIGFGVEKRGGLPSGETRETLLIRSGCNKDSHWFTPRFQVENQLHKWTILRNRASGYVSVDRGMHVYAYWYAQHRHHDYSYARVFVHPKTPFIPRGATGARRIKFGIHFQARERGRAWL
jgi:hypothetical protein